VPPTRMVRRARRGLAATVVVVALVGQGCQPAASPLPTSTAPAAASSGPSAAAAAPSCPAPTPGSPPITAQEPWRDRTFYEVFVRSFADSNGDGIGDLAGLTAHLDALNDGNPATTTDLGVGGLWLMPVAEAASYHGYDVTDYTAVEPDYGDMADMRALVRAAHDRGMLVVLDFVINHTSTRNPWFQDALAGGPHRDWYIWSDHDPGWPSVAGPNPWHETKAGDFYYGAFDVGMPDLNLRNPDVTAELERIAGVWLQDVGVDGFRIDAAKHLIEDGPNAQVNTPETKAWLQGFRDAIHAMAPTALVLGEVYDARGISSSYTRDGSLDMAFDFGIGPAIANGVYGDATTTLASIDEVAARYDPGVAGTFLSNHDQTRFMTQLKGDVEAAKRAAAVLLTGPGVPFVYYGEELGMTGTKPDELLRTPYPWTAAAPGHGFTSGTPWEPFSDGAATANLATEAADPASIWSTYRDLIAVRDATPAIAYGDLVRVKASSRAVAAWLRWTADERVLVIHNLGRDALHEVRFDLAAGPLCGSPQATLVYASAPSGAAVAAPTITAAGGLDGYVPLADLPAGASVVIDLTERT
jgi:alpha-amylase